MLVVRTTEGNILVRLEKRRSWSVPELLSIQHCTACDAELRFIKEHFAVPIPHPLPERVIWFGDTARFIVANLCN